MDASTPSSRLAYADFASPSEMSADCRAVGQNLRLPRLEQAALAATRTAPSLRFEDYPSEIDKREVRVTDAARRLADALHLHLD